MNDDHDFPSSRFCFVQSHLVFSVLLILIIPMRIWQRERERKCKRDYSKLLLLLQFALKCRKRKSNKTCRPSLLLTYRDIYTRQGGIRYDDYFFFFFLYLFNLHTYIEWPVEWNIYTFFFDMTNIEGITLYHYQGNVYRKDLFVDMSIIMVIRGEVFSYRKEKRNLR